MGLRINGIDGSYSVPNVNKRAYRFAKFEARMTFGVRGADGRPQDKTVDVKPKIQPAWNFITGRAANHKPCNDYFKSLRRNVTLKQVLEEGDIILHCLVPKEGHTFDELPDANTAGRDIGIDPSYLLDPDSMGLAATLIHELAHVAGGTTNPRDDHAGEAEEALNHCLCQSKFRSGTLGVLELPELRSAGRQRLA
jgi:hypothetical protein